MLFVQCWGLLSMSCGIWQRILTSCTVFRMVPWQLCPGVRTQSSGELGRAGTLASSHWHTCPCPHGTLEIKALLFLEGGAADGQESAQELNPPTRAVFSGGSFGGYSTCRRQPEGRENPVCLSPLIYTLSIGFSLT